MDRYVGLWLRDIPYIWLKTEDTQSHTLLDGHIRKYLLPKIAYTTALQRINGTYTPLDAEYIVHFPSDATCGIEQLRMFMVYDKLNVDGFGMWLFDDTSYEIRVNGHTLNIPQYITASTDATIYDLYDILGISLPSQTSLRRWQSELLVKLDQPQPPYMYKHIVLPRITSSGDTTGRSRFTGESQRVWLNSLMLRVASAAPSRYGTNKVWCIPTTSSSKIKGYEAFAVIGDVSTEGKVSVRNTDLLENLKLCKDTQTVLIPILWNIQDGDRAHMNLVILVSSTAYIFDPWGSSFIDARELIKGIKYILSRGELDGGVLTILTPGEWCPKLSFQTLDRYVSGGGKLRPAAYRKGYCAVWVLWMIETLLLNPNIPPPDLPRAAIQRMLENEGSLNETIEAYASQIF